MTDKRKEALEWIDTIIQYHQVASSTYDYNSNVVLTTREALQQPDYKAIAQEMDIIVV